MTYDVVLTLWPTRAPITVTEQEANALFAQGLIYSSTPTLGVPVLAGTELVDGGTASARVALLKLRAGTAAQWATAETSAAVLSAGEFAVVTDQYVLVRGDGTTKVASLPRYGGGTTIDGGTP